MKVHVWFLTIAMVCATQSLAKTKNNPDFAAPGFSLKEVDVLYVLPTANATSDQDEQIEPWLRSIDVWTPYDLKKRGYRTVPESKWKRNKIGAYGFEPKLIWPPGYSAPQRVHLNEQELKEPQQDWIRTLSPAGAHWLLLPATQDANFYRKSYKFGSKVVLTGILFDKQRGIVVWRGTASGETVEYSTLGSLIPGVKGGGQKNASMRAAKELSGMMDKR